MAHVTSDNVTLVPGVADFIGFVGLAVPPCAPPFPHAAEPVVEIGWRLGATHWGHGYAVEAATATLTYALGVLSLPEVLSWTVPGNVRSRRVMERIGMTYVQEFDHPRLAADSPLRRHVLYRVTP
jgi:RimJ/RimL family protein N-acetyltransferase